MPVHRRVTPQHYVCRYPFIHLGGEGHDTMSPARARTQTARSRDERTNHEATAPEFTWQIIIFFYLGGNSPQMVLWPSQKPRTTTQYCLSISYEDLFARTSEAFFSTYKFFFSHFQNDSFHCMTLVFNKRYNVS